MKSKERIRGVRAWVAFIPTIVFILILLMTFVIVTVLINKRSEKDANNAHKATECISLISTLQSRSSSMAETLSSYIYNPAIPTEFEMKEIPPGSGNMVPTRPIKWRYNNEPITSYYETVTSFQTPDEVFDTFNEEVKKYEYIISNDDTEQAVLTELAQVVERMKYMEEVQKQALYVVSQVNYEGFETPKYILEAVGDYEFTEADLEVLNDPEVTNDKIIDYALDIIFDKDYATSKKKVANSITSITSTLREESAKIEGASDKVVWHLRRTLWALTALIIISLAAFFFIMVKKLIHPITSFADDIQNNEMLDDEKGLYEVNYLARSYNELLDKKSDFEHRLKSVAETDPLTGFPNRYCYNEYLKKIKNDNCSYAIYMLDINNLKYVNDTFGHDKGDELIKNAAACIKKAFFNKEERNCFRLGGDEFIAILKDVDESNVHKLLEEFIESQKEFDVSIATGLSFTENISKINIDKLIAEADEKMYINKKIMKGEI